MHLYIQNMAYLNYLLGFAIAVFVIKFNYNKQGQPPNIQPTIRPVVYKGMFMPKVSKNKVIHVHHWVLSVPLIIFGTSIIQGAGLAVCLHGLSYSDRFSFIEDSPY